MSPALRFVINISLSPKYPSKAHIYKSKGRTEAAERQIALIDSFKNQPEIISRNVIYTVYFITQTILYNSVGKKFSHFVVFNFTIFSTLGYYQLNTVCKPTFQNTFSFKDPDVGKNKVRKFQTNLSNYTCTYFSCSTKWFETFNIT